ncbi:MAG: hypothetical protein Unbinned4388contig1000_75 [Prokaryotic dsDNA virus sp.]|nr:MAG: hypothetical protein Unbinned4388contig1000_75 [Prokaryotic dsDNA virus sp.]|tara:strand:+ start:5745 stop:6563 length:819 start_codon:yes stop_codon:yes gene_type:complete
MKYAIKDGVKIEAYPSGRASCQGCKEEVIAKCGDIMTWHWAHKHICECDTKPMTEWHYKWQEQFPEENREVRVEKEDGSFRIADIKLDGGLVIEFQHSKISLRTVKEREGFHGNMIWVYDCTDVIDRIWFSEYDNYKEYKLNWKWAWKTALESKRVYLHLMDNILFDVDNKRFVKIVCGKMNIATKDDLDKYKSIRIYRAIERVKIKYSDEDYYKIDNGVKRVLNPFFEDSVKERLKEGYEVLHKDKEEGDIVMRKIISNGVFQTNLIKRYI